MAKYKKVIIRRPKRKYNIEQRPVEFTTPSTAENGFHQNQVEIVPATNIEGVRQVARLRISLTPNSFEGTPTNIPIYWALVYIPEGTTTTALFPNSTTLFNPSNYVLNSGIVNPQAGPVTISTKLRKNLNANDRIFLFTACKEPAWTFLGLVRYAICYN